MAGFTYRLEPLLGFRQSSLQLTRQALSAAEERLESARQALLQAEEEVSICEQALSVLAGNPPMYLSALSFLREQRLRCQALSQAVTAAEQDWAQARAVLQNARAELKQVEKHKERHRLAAREREQRKVFREQDEAWLQRRRQGGA
ncbi:flagellar export protein FliJ [Chromobacterium alkanivorans]|uniref:hypothetical protein n=1 Tax=Chromobacterium alkanivorans TaxID=1071719 RepID=UPI001967D2D9|nr:hypothetical protein [Chromobacterium alkanivorans]MBN3005511.1 hypothetical protein [Chromobacterium alkanivorans]MCS3806398.1 flagellar export protein FliJ [Chromobacterium alkanivorans]MCS3820590.1 flagellar export protein FliJ [Chromobacterium alkanivorans]MCS3875348.1 flagellar export protein FliJ [Chromobacterium alkanivorans]